MTEEKRLESEQYRDKIRGCMIGGAVGDTLGYPIEFLRENVIKERYGEKGITAYQADPRKGKPLISDDTQMSLFTANGLLVGDTMRCLKGVQEPPVAYVFDAYMDWYKTQELPYGSPETKERLCWLLDVPELFARRVPGTTCIAALEELKYQGTHGYRDIYLNRNDRKGAGGIMRVAPLALDYGGLEHLGELDKAAGDLARITHCHSLGYMPAAALVHIINRIVYPPREMSLEEIVAEARDTVARIYEDDDHLHVLLKIMNLALRLAGNDSDDLTNIHQLGEGWVAEETLGIAIYCALRYRNDFSSGVIAAVNHKGDSDTTGAVAGNLLGALCGYEAIDEKWKTDLELKDVILEIADDLCYGCPTDENGRCSDPAWEEKYINKKRYMGNV